MGRSTVLGLGSPDARRRARRSDGPRGAEGAPQGSTRRRRTRGPPQCTGRPQPCPGGGVSGDVTGRDYSLVSAVVRPPLTGRAGAGGGDAASGETAQPAHTRRRPRTPPQQSWAQLYALSLPPPCRFFSRTAPEHRAAGGDSDLGEGHAARPRGGVRPAPASGTSAARTETALPPIGRHRAGAGAGRRVQKAAGRKPVLRRRGWLQDRLRGPSPPCGFPRLRRASPSFRSRD